MTLIYNHFSKISKTYCWCATEPIAIKREWCENGIPHTNRRNERDSNILLFYCCYIVVMHGSRFSFLSGRIMKQAQWMPFSIHLLRNFISIKKILSQNKWCTCLFGIQIWTQTVFFHQNLYFSHFGFIATIAPFFSLKKFPKITLEKSWYLIQKC